MTERGQDLERFTFKAAVRAETRELARKATREAEEKMFSPREGERLIPMVLVDAAKEFASVLPPERLEDRMGIGGMGVATSAELPGHLEDETPIGIVYAKSIYGMVNFGLMMSGIENTTREQILEASVSHFTEATRKIKEEKQ